MTQEMMADVRLVENLKPVTALATVTFDTVFGEITISRIKVIHSEGKQPWVALPDIRYKDKAGEFKSIQIIIPGFRLKKAIFEVVINKYQELGVA